MKIKQKTFLPIIVLIFLCSFFHEKITAQIGGSGTYEFLNLPNSARVAAMGGVNIAVRDSDVNSAFQNPSLMDSAMANQFSVSYVNYFAGIYWGYVAYAMDAGKIGTFDVGMHFINYGDFVGADSAGNITNHFNAGEYDFNIGWGKDIDSNFSVGANLKTIYSSLELYNSVGMAVDLAGTYYNHAREFTLAAVIKNIGTELTTYRPGNHESLPFEMQVGVSKRLKHTPFRFSLTATHLEQLDISYINPKDSINVDPVSGDTTYAKNTLADKIMRHIVIGCEVLVSKNVNLRFAYNYERRKELEIPNQFGLEGFSAGIGIRVSKFNFSYGMAFYSTTGPSNTFTLITNLAEFYTKKNKS
jgi:hypothetical protein